MKIVTVIGARPQFIKAAAVSRIIRKEHQEILVHTGQHYDANMSDVFFEELEIPIPEYNLGINGGTHGQMTGEMLIKIEEVLQKEQPDLLLVYGDTNSTVAAALAAVKIHIPVCHVEAGNRLRTLSNPEEINRVVTDHISTLLLCCTNSASDFLYKENVLGEIHIVGDPMFDAFSYYSKRLDKSVFQDVIGLDGTKVNVPEEFYYLTCHREENTNSDKVLFEILSAMQSLDKKVIYPVHPRNKARASRIVKEHGLNNIILIEPVGYLTSIAFVKNACKIITDSGGLQREAFFADVQCVTIFDYVVWPETMVGNRNQLARPDKTDILAKLLVVPDWTDNYRPFGDGHSGEKILSVINEYFS